jgi:hypothetical protein
MHRTATLVEKLDHLRDLALFGTVTDRERDAIRDALLRGAKCREILRVVKLHRHSKRDQ